MSRQRCTCRPVDRGTDPCGHSDTSDGCPSHDPQSVGTCPGCGGMLVDGGGDDFTICDACGDEWPKD